MNAGLLGVVMGCFSLCACAAGELRMKPAGGWRVDVVFEGAAHTFALDPPNRVDVNDERYDALALFQGPVWRRGTPLQGMKAEACSVTDALFPESLIVRDGPGTDARMFRRGVDYELEPRWGGFGCIEGGSIVSSRPVYASYRYTLMRLDSVVQTSDGRLTLRKGVPHVATPRPPELAAGETRLGNLWVCGHGNALEENQCFPVLETRYPEPPLTGLSVAERLLPKTIAKLRAGEPVRILAWGDSVTACVYLPQALKWQERFAARLRQRFPRADICLLSEGWGGHTTGDYQREPSGSPHNFAEKVLACKPDLIVSEFVNDAFMDEAAVFENYERLRKEFEGIGAEWVILAPHYVRPDWMGLACECGIDDDPRPYVRGLRLFAERNRVALADVSRRWGRLWRQGIPYSTLLVNNVNHPNAEGLGVFADALMALFP